MKKILETKRLILREMVEEDFADLCKMLKDPVVMTAYEHAFDDDEAWDWLQNQKKRYQKDGFGLWAVVLKDRGEMIGQCGLTWQAWNEKPVLEVGYLFKKAMWHQGYATEAAAACKKYGFDQLDASAVYAIIRDTNKASQAVAKRIQMTLCGKMIKQYYGMEMPHFVYKVLKKDA